MGELIFVNIGHAGVRIGETCWELFCKEHSIDSGGTPLPAEAGRDTVNPHSIFSQLSNGRYVPRTLFADTDITPIDDIKRSNQRDLFSRDSVVSGKEDSASNFIRGEMTIGRGIMEDTLDKLRRLTEKCESLQGIIFNHSLGGGTGSGFTSALTGRISVDYGNKLTKIGATVYPSESTLTTVVEPYNTVLSTNFLLQHLTASIFFRNSRIQTMLERSFDIENPSFADINKYIAQTVSSVTWCVRQLGEPGWNLNSLATNLVPYPRIHFLMSSYLPQSNLSSESLSTSALTSQVFSQEHNPYPRMGWFMSSALMYRGMFNHPDIVKELYSIRQNKMAKFVEWVPSAFKVAVSHTRPYMVSPEGKFQQGSKSVCTLSNYTAIQDIFERTSLLFDKMYNYRAFVHWYVGEGLDSGFFSEARQNHAALEKDYDGAEERPWDFQDDFGEEPMDE